MPKLLPLAALALFLANATQAQDKSLSPQPTTVAQTPAQQQVFAAERAFARSMAERDFAAFGKHLSEEAVFFGSRQVLRGKDEVLKGWKGFFDGPQAPFSWEPEVVEVLASGTLAHSSGPVRDEKGQPVMQFNSIWRQESPGVWKVVFDKGTPLPPAKPAVVPASAPASAPNSAPTSTPAPNK